MELFLPTLSKMCELFLYILIGYIVSRYGIAPDNSSKVLSKLENNIFIPALVMGTFMGKFTIEKMTVAWKFVLGGLVVSAISIPIAILVARACSKDSYIRKIYTYGLAFSNFGFMGNAVVQAIFPEIFQDYLIYTLPFWTFIYICGVPVLLIPAEGEDADAKRSLKSRLRSFVNPMFIAMLIGMALGLTAQWVTVPAFVGNAVNTLGSCMSPVAMLLTGMTIAKIDLKETFTNISVYIVSLIRLIAIPMVGILALMLLPLPKDVAVCTVCALAMPLGLSTVVVPSGYGLDTRVAAGMALISHLLSCITIPVIFMLYETLVK